jgi:hypothetical protein
LPHFRHKQIFTIDLLASPFFLSEILKKNMSLLKGHDNEKLFSVFNGETVSRMIFEICFEFPEKFEFENGKFESLNNQTATARYKGYGEPSKSCSLPSTIQKAHSNANSSKLCQF